MNSIEQCKQFTFKLLIIEKQVYLLETKTCAGIYAGTKGDVQAFIDKRKLKIVK